MYQQSSSLTAEFMNAANKSVRDCTAVDPINAMLLLLKLEARRFSKNKEKAWSWTEVLTPHGKKLSDKAFSKVNPRDYSITIDAELDKYVCAVSRMTLNYTYTCWFPSSYDEDRSLFGGCSCGVQNTNGIPCHHMCAVVKSYRIDGLNETNVMPTWWHTFHWHKQYPSDSFVSCNTDIQSLHNTAQVNSHNSRNKYVLCPPCSGPQKGGRPREKKQIKGSIELAMEKKKETIKDKKKRKVPIKPDDQVEYRSTKRKKKMEEGAKKKQQRTI